MNSETDKNKLLPWNKENTPDFRSSAKLRSKIGEAEPVSDASNKKASLAVPLSPIAPILAKNRETSAADETRVESEQSAGAEDGE